MATDPERSVPPPSGIEHFLWKIVRAATAFKSASDHWYQCQRRSASLRRHVQRCSTVAAVLLKASTCATTFGSAAKIVGGVATAVGVVSRVPALTHFGGKLWRAGCVSKLGGFGARVLAEIWERGFKETLTAYTANIAGFLQSMTLLRTVLEELEVLMPPDLDVGRFMPLLLLVCPEELFPYAYHIVKLFISSDNYSALHDFASMAMSSFSCPVTMAVNILHEAESYHLSAVLGSLPVPLSVAASALHVGKEVMDFSAGIKEMHLQNHELHSIRRLMHKLRNSSTLLLTSMRNLPLMNNNWMPHIPVS